MTTIQSTRTAQSPPPSSPAQASLYQQLRGHLAVLKLHDAAEHLPAVLDAAHAEGLSLTAALERLLAIEVDATEARRLVGRLRFASLPTPATLADQTGLASGDGVDDQGDQVGLGVSGAGWVPAGCR